VEATSLTTVRDEMVAVSEGRPNQSFQLLNRPIQPETLVLELEMPQRAGESEEQFDILQRAPDQEEKQWKRVPDFLSSGKDESVYTLNATTGTITFGDGVKHGRIPPAGIEITARQYCYGGGKAANVAVNMINAPLADLSGIESVTNERPAVGGQDEQTVEDLKEKAPAQLRGRDRAITVEDFKNLAGNAGGVAKATVVPLMNPHFPGVKVPGAVTVVIVPDNQETPPRPSSDLIRSVGQFLDQKRMIATELYVKGPEYLEISIQAVVEAEAYAAFDSVKREIMQRLNESQYLDPHKQDFGKDFYATNLYNVMLDVDDVRAVRTLAVTVNGSPIPQERMSIALKVPPDGLVFGNDHNINIVPPDADEL
jgi:predicted phage baseplate assembly protein